MEVDIVCANLKQNHDLEIAAVNLRQASARFSFHACDFPLPAGQARTPAYPRLRGRGHEAADGAAGTGGPKVGGTNRVRELHSDLRVHR